MHKINVTYSSTCYFTPLCRTEALSDFLLLKVYCNESALLFIQHAWKAYKQ